MGSTWNNFALVCHCLVHLSLSTPAPRHLILQTAWASARKVEEVAPAAENYSAQPPSSKVWCPGEEVGPQTHQCPALGPTFKVGLSETFAACAAI